MARPPRGAGGDEGVGERGRLREKRLKGGKERRSAKGGGETTKTLTNATKRQLARQHFYKQGFEKLTLAEWRSRPRRCRRPNCLPRR